MPPDRAQLIHRRAAPVDVTESAGIYRAEVTHPCGHVFRSPSGFNDEAAARRHGAELSHCACGTCRYTRGARA